METPPTLSIVSLFMNADIIVKGVLLLLLAASVWSWTVIIDKLWRLGAVSRSARAHEARAAGSATQPSAYCASPAAPNSKATATLCCNGPNVRSFTRRQREAPR